MRWVGVVAVVAAALGLSATSAEARLDGALRQSFTDGVHRSCLAKQKTMSVNAGISENLLSGYCSCVAGFIADNANPDRLVLAGGDIKRGAPPAWLTAMQKQATDYCVANIRDYVKSN